MDFLVRAGLVEPGWTMVMQVINFIILYAVLKHFLFVPVATYMENRRKKIERDLSEAARKNIEAVELLSTYNQKIEGIKKEARIIGEETREAAKRQAAKIIGEARDEAESVRIKSLKASEDDRRRALREAKGQIAGLAIDAAQKIIGETLNDDKSIELIDRFIEETEDMSWGN